MDNAAVLVTDRGELNALNVPHTERAALVAGSVIFPLSFLREAVKTADYMLACEASNLGCRRRA